MPEADALRVAMDSLGLMLEPARLGLLLLGVVMGLIVGMMPGLGGITGLSILLPFTFDLDPYSALALLLGLACAVATGDVFPAILFGVPGTVGCAATVLDGYPMARRGEAGRALSAAFISSLLGGWFGAIVLALAIPIMRPVVLFFGAPEMVAICVFGITLVASLSGNAPLKGLMAASIGLLLSMIGTDAATGTHRFTFGAFYLWEGIPIVPVALGLFAIPELCDLMINRSAISRFGRGNVMQGQWQGFKDVMQNWFLVLRTAAIGTGLGMIPGFGASVIDWIAYGHAARTVKGASATFGKGDVRGVIGSESSTNAREGGALIPTIAFGIPVNPGQAIILGAFILQGIVPGPDMLVKHLDLTYTIVWSLPLANGFSTLICFVFANQFARIATVRYTLLVPLVTGLVFQGSLEGRQSWDDIVAMLAIGALAWTMKRNGWPRPPLMLGFILGPLIERYTSISMNLYGWRWLENWFVLLVFAVAVLGVARQALRHRRVHRRGAWSLRAPALSLGAGLALLVSALCLAAIYIASEWGFQAKLMPEMIAVTALVLALTLAATELFRQPIAVATTSSVVPSGDALVAMDLQTEFDSKLAPREINRRGLVFFAWTLGLLAVGYVCGFLVALLAYFITFMRWHGRESWRTALVVSGSAIAVIWVAFNVVFDQTWPTPLVGMVFPGLLSHLPWL
jgi:TctA family transporter